MDVDDVVEQQRAPVLAPRLQDVHLDALVADAGVRVADVAQVGDPGLLHHRQVAAVVHDPHRIGLGEPDPQLVRELVGAGIGGRVGRDAHALTVGEADTRPS